jgi:hypothetical protein
MRIICGFSLFFCLISCQNTPPESRADRIATGICGCTEQLLNLNKQAATSTDSIDFEGIQQEFEKARACIVEQRMKPEDMAPVQKSLEVKCPALAAEAELLGELLVK